MENQTWSKTLAAGFTLPAFRPTATLAEVVSLTLKAVAEHLRSSATVRDYLTALPKGPGTSCSDSPVDELVKYVAIRNAKIKKNDPVVNLAFMRDIMAPVFAFSRQQVCAAVRICNDLTLLEENLFFHAQDLAQAVDQLWIKWFETVAAPYQQVATEDQTAYRVTLSKELAEFDYTAFDLGKDAESFLVVNRQPWAKAFHEETQGVLFAIQTIIDHDLVGTIPGHPLLINYFSALYSAYACHDIDKLEECWAEVDRCWIQLPADCRILPVHGMENGYEHLFCVSPEFRLEVRDPQTQELINQVRIATIEFFDSLQLGNKGALKRLGQLLRTKLDQLDVGTFLPALVGGVCLNFRYAGQAVPNRQEVLAEGGKIFLDPTSTEDAARDYPDFLKNHCTPDTVALLAPLLTADNIMRYIAHHEFFHPVGCTQESDQTLGSTKSLLEEAKATIGGLLAWQKAENKPEQDLVILAVALARVIRHLDKTKMNDPAIAPYIRKSLVIATLLLDSGVIELTETGIQVHPEENLLEIFFSEALLFIEDLINAYRTGNTHELKFMYTQYCDIGPNGAEKLINWINR